MPAQRAASDRASVGSTSCVTTRSNSPSCSASAAGTIRALKLDPAKVNVYGGGISLGHPLGCTGAKLLTTLVHALSRRNTQFGLVTMCIGVGQGIAMIVERV